MPRLNFLDFVGRSVSKDRVREMCKRMELGTTETEFILDKYCSGIENLTLEQCDIPIDQLKTLIPHLIRKVRGWIQHNTGYFALEELEGMVMYQLVRDKDVDLVDITRRKK